MERRQLNKKTIQAGYKPAWILERFYMSIDNITESIENNNEIKTDEIIPIDNGLNYVAKPVDPEKVVNIICMAWSAKDAPYYQGERWGLNSSYIYGELDRLFWLHDTETTINSLQFDDYITCLSEIIKKNPKLKIYSLESFNIEQSPQDPNQIMVNVNPANPCGDILLKTIEFPRNKVAALMSGYYFTSSVTYMLALAIAEGFDRIRIYGLEAFAGTNENEYAFERQGIQDWVMFAKGQGIKVEIPFLNMVTAMNGTNNCYGYNRIHYGKK